MSETTSPPGPRIGPRIGIVRFTGLNSDFRALVTRGALLELVTFGFYRFWLATDIRRHLWVNTEIGGDALEYTGRAKELLLGFLIALAVLVPIFLAYFIAGLAAEQWKAFASVPLYAFLFLFGQFAVYRARRYRLTRTVWRGVRFWMTGSGWAYALRSFLWALLLIPTLGLAYPWRMAALERYKFRHTRYGTLQARFEATGGQLFRRVWWIWLLGLLPVLGMAAGGALAAVGEYMGAEGGALAGIAAGVISLGSTAFFALPFLHAARVATEWRWWAGGIRFGTASIACTLPRGALIGSYWVVIGMSMLVLFIFALIGGALAAMVFVALLQGVGSDAITTRLMQYPLTLGAIYVVWYLGLLLCIGVVVRVYLVQRIWARVARSCAVIGIEAADRVGAAGHAASALGEGLADGLDFAGF